MQQHGIEGGKEVELGDELQQLAVGLAGVVLSRQAEKLI
jgi:hypothetical protein